MLQDALALAVIISVMFIFQYITHTPRKQEEEIRGKKIYNQWNGGEDKQRDQNKVKMKMHSEDHKTMAASFALRKNKCLYFEI